MLSITAPVALGTVRAVSELATQVGENFAAALHADMGPVAHAQDSFDQRLSAFAERLRDWLQQQGMNCPFEIALRASRQGPADFEISGPEASHISNLLNLQPSWKAEMQELSSSFQGLATDMAASGVRLRITDLTAQASLL